MSVIPEAAAAWVITQAGTFTDNESGGLNMTEQCLSLFDLLLSVPCAQLVVEQRSMQIYAAFEALVSLAEVKDKAHGSFLEEYLLVKKWVPCVEVVVGNRVFQFVVPLKFRSWFCSCS